jgi:Bacterial SH3 domain
VPVTLVSRLAGLCFASLVLLLVGAMGAEQARAQQNGHLYVANLLPPDDYLALRSLPSSQAGHRITILRSGELVDVLDRRGDGWWRVHVVATGVEGWALSGGGGRQWIVCCQAETAAPAPSSEPSYFHTPTDNIHCMGSNYDDGPNLRCDLRQISNPLPIAPADCPLSYGDAYVITQNASVGALFCHGDTVEMQGSPVLPYGAVWQAFGFTCRSATDGLTCNNASGHGFFLSRIRQTVF